MTMDTVAANPSALNWADITSQLDAEGWALLPGVLPPANCEEVTRAVALNDLAATGQKLEHAAPGQGERIALSPSLSLAMPHWQTLLYNKLVATANRWAETRSIPQRYPEKLTDFQAQHQVALRTAGRAGLLRLREDDYLALQLGVESEEDFPLQLVGLLSRPGEDFTGGEFVMTEQRPRMQSRPMVLPLRQGDFAIIAAGTRPVKGTRDHYGVTTRHAISRIRSGQRLGLDLTFHHVL